MAFLAPSLPFISAGTQLIQGVGGFLSGQKNKQLLDQQAAGELTAAQQQERMQQEEARRQIGTQLAAQWGNGLEGGSGTALDAVRESEIQAALDARTIRDQGVSRAAALRAKGSQEASQGAFSLASGMVGAATSFGKMSHDWAQARSGTTPAGAGGYGPSGGSTDAIPIAKY